MTDQQDVEVLMKSLQRNLHLALEQKVNSEAMSEVISEISRIFKEKHSENKVSQFVADLVLLNKSLGEKITVIWLYWSINRDF